MGICYPDAKLFWEAHLAGASFKNTLTAGHQRLFLHRSEAKYFEQEYAARTSKTLKSIEGYALGDFADDVLSELLGIETLSVMDYSDYEGAELVHDLNLPVPTELHGRYDAVIDSGTLEHIFNFPVAVGNLMKMVKVGGRIFITTPANNHCGHGFYQFSPELMFRVFSEANGFTVARLLMFESDYPSIELSENHVIYDVADPDAVRGRVGIVSSKPVTMMVEAVKTADVPLFETSPLQSDYVAMWGQDADQPETRRTLFSRIAERLRWVPIIRGHLENKRFSFSNKRFYKRVS